MLEAINQNIESPTQIVQRVLETLRDLHRQSTAELTDEERIAEGMSSQIIGKTTQRALQALIDVETAKIVAQADSDGWEPAYCIWQKEMSQKLTADIFKEHWFESTLSDADHPIHSATYGTSMLRYDIRRKVANGLTLEDAEKFAWIMFDANGLRSFKDCTSHDTTTHYLKAVARIFVSEESQARQYLAQNNISVIPMATGGDEFVLYLNGENPMTHEMIDKVVSLFQQEISESTELQAFLDFTDEGVRKQFAFTTSAERKKFEALPAEERKQVLDSIGDTLPDKFIPSFSGGGALLKDGILRAVERDDDDLRGDDETFHTLREKIVQATIDLAEERQKKNKEQGLRTLEQEDPKTLEFRLRNNENRAQLKEIQRLQRVESELRALFQKLFFPDLQDSGKSQQHQNGDNTNDDVADAFQLAVHRNVVEDQGNDEQNNEWSDGTHEEKGKWMRRVTKFVTLIRRLAARIVT